MNTTREDLPERVVVDGNGAYWRDFGEFYSMCPVSSDNDPVVVQATYVRAEADYAPEYARLWHESQAQVARLRDGLRRLLDCRGPYEGTVSERGGDPAVCSRCADEARALLSASQASPSENRPASLGQDTEGLHAPPDGIADDGTVTLHAHVPGYPMGCPICKALDDANHSDAASGGSPRA